jgi:hypothetical protein
MNDRPTPETDAEEAKCEDMHHVKWGRTGWDFASRMERERDDARQELSDLSHAMGQLLTEARRERDEARSQADGFARVLQHLITLAAIKPDEIPDFLLGASSPVRDGLASYRETTDTNSPTN